MSRPLAVAVLLLVPGLSWAGPAAASFDASAPLHPLLAGSPSELGGPLAQSLALQAGRLAQAPGRPELLSLEAPLDRFSARTLARAALSREDAARLLAAHADLAAGPVGDFLRPLAARPLSGEERGAYERLLAAAGTWPGLAPPGLDPFDGAAPSPSLELGEISFRGSRLVHGGAKAQRLGRGDFGLVDAHPLVPGAVIKTVSLAAETEFMLTFLRRGGAPGPDAVALREEETARGLAAAGAGPRFLGTGEIEGVPATVRERVYGSDVARLIAERRFGPKERGLVVDLLRRLARAGVRASELKTSNIMIGRTWRDREAKAYLVDGETLLPLESNGEEASLAELLSQEALVGAIRIDPYVGLVIPTRPFSEILDAGVRSSQTPSLLERFGALWRR